MRQNAMVSPATLTLKSVLGLFLLHACLQAQPRVIQKDSTTLATKIQLPRSQTAVPGSQRAAIIKASSLIVGLSALFVNGDAYMDEEYGIEREQSPLYLPNGLNAVGEAYDEAGARSVLLGSIVSGLIVGSVFPETRLRRTALLLATAVPAASIITWSAKSVIGRERPFGNGGNKQFNWFKFSSVELYRSMPSGHTTSAFALATVFAKQYPRKAVVIPAYIFASGVAFQRIQSRNHWTSDVVVGACVGYFTTDLMHRFLGSKVGSPVTPAISPTSLGLVLQF